MTSIKLTTTALIAMAVAGCNQMKFYGDNEPTTVGRLAEAQAATGAAADAMLYDAHFDGTTLNSLGQGKLDLMLKGTPAGQPVRVYLNMPHDAESNREASVAGYLKSAGLGESQFVLAEGANPNTNTPTAYTLGGAYKGDGPAMTGAPAQVAAPPGGGISGGGGSH